MTAQQPQREWCEGCTDFEKGMEHGESGIGTCKKLNRTITWQQWCILRDAGCGIRSSPHTTAAEGITADEVGDMCDQVAEVAIRKATLATLDAITAGKTILRKDGFEYYIVGKKTVDAIRRTAQEQR
jgi:hypothetical protein